MPSASYSTVFHPTPTPSRKRLFDRIATSAACLATRAVWRCGRISTHEVSSRRLGDRRREREERERLVERDVLVVRALEATRAVALGAEHVVVGQQMGEAEILQPLEIVPDRAGIGPDLVVGEDGADSHGQCLAVRGV